MVDTDWSDTMPDVQYQIFLDQQVAQNLVCRIVVVFGKAPWIVLRMDFFRYHRVLFEPISRANSNNLANMAKSSAIEVLLVDVFELLVISLLNMHGLKLSSKVLIHLVNKS